MKAPLTKEEAKKLICPFMSRPTLTPTGNIIHMDILCWTDECMAWRDLPLSDGRGYCVRLNPEPPPQS